MSHYNDEFFAYNAVCVKLDHGRRKGIIPIATITIRSLFPNIPHFPKYKYAILIRKEKISTYLNWELHCEIQEKANETEKTLFAFFRLLTHEFLHAVEWESDTKIYTGNLQKDEEIVIQAMKAIQKLHNFSNFLSVISTKP